MSFPRYVRPDELYSLSASYAGSSEKVGYEASLLVQGDPAFGWWASSGSATITATLAATQDVDIVAVIHGNTDDGRAITLGGAFSGATLTGARGAGDYPRNVAYIAPAAISASTISAAVSGNSAAWAVGAFVFGKLRECPFPLDRGASRSHERIVADDPDDTFKHTIRYDFGGELWSARGRMFADDAALAELLAWWESSRGGTRPTLIVMSEVDAEPRLCRLTVTFSHTNDGSQQHWIQWTLEEISRGMVVI